MAAPPLKPTEWTDQEWIAALTANHDDAWARLRETIHRGLSVYVREQARDRPQAAFVVGLIEDATQEALLAVRAKLGTFRGASRFTTWVYRVAVNVLLGQFRRRRWEARAQTLSSALPDWPLARGDRGGGHCRGGKEVTGRAPLALVWSVWCRFDVGLGARECTDGTVHRVLQGAAGQGTTSGHRTPIGDVRARQVTGARALGLAAD
jgi:hypothetical protein